MRCLFLLLFLVLSSAVAKEATGEARVFADLSWRPKHLTAVLMVEGNPANLICRKLFAEERGKKIEDGELLILETKALVCIGRKRPRVSTQQFGVVTYTGELHPVVAEDYDFQLQLVMVRGMEIVTGTRRTAMRLELPWPNYAKLSKKGTAEAQWVEEDSDPYFRLVVKSHPAFALFNLATTATGFEIERVREGVHHAKCVTAFLHGNYEITFAIDTFGHPMSIRDISD